MAILAFDLTEKRSVAKLQEVFIPLLHDSVHSCLTIIVGTKLDLATGNDRQVKTSEGRQLAEEEHRLQLEKAVERDPGTYLRTVQAKKLYFETSAKSGDGVSEIFELIQSVVLPELERQAGGSGGGRVKDRSITVGEAADERKDRPCCNK